MSNSKEFTKLQKRVYAMFNKLRDLFGWADFDGAVISLFSELLDLAQKQDSIAEEAKAIGAYDAVLHARDKAELEAAKIEVRRLSQLQSVKIAMEYARDIAKIGGNDMYSQHENTMAQSQLQTEVKRFFDTFKTGVPHE